MEILLLNNIDDEVMLAFEKLIQQLNSKTEIPSKNYLTEIIKAKDSYIFLTKEKEIVSILMLILYKIPSGRKAWIEDVVVDDNRTGSGVGSFLVNYAIKFAKEKGISQFNELQYTACPIFI